MIRSMPPPCLSTHLLPTTLDPEQLPGCVAVMIDVLRASTTITYAVAADCGDIFPCRAIQEARDLAASLASQAPLLAGERGGTQIPGFDLDNSPASYTPETVKGRTIVFTTTNGTATLAACGAADVILVGAFSNLSAIVETLAELDKPVHLACAGTNGMVTAEDCLCAGAIGLQLRSQGRLDTHSNDATRMTIEMYQRCRSGPTTLADELRNSHGGRNLQQLGFDTDIECAARRDRLALVPVFDPQRGTIRAMQPQAMRT